MPAYRLNRSGQFTVRTTGPNHCGTTDRLTIRYRLDVGCPASALDSRGFLFDQVQVQTWFDRQTTTALSCEAYAQFCGRELYKVMRMENPNIAITHLELALSPEPFAAEITFVWDGSTPAKATQTVQTLPLTMRSQQYQMNAYQFGLFAEAN